MVRRGGVTWIAVLVAISGQAAADASAADAIYVMRPNGKDVRRVAVVQGAGGHRSPQWSRDGKQIAFDANPGTWNQGHWYLVNADGTDLRMMGEHDIPHFSPDDKQVVYHHYGGGGTKSGIWVQNLDGGGRTWLAAGTAGRWSPDGSRIAYTDWRSVFALDLVAENTEILHSENFDKVYPGFDWSPDGKLLAAVVDREKRRDLVLIDGKETKLLLKNPNLDGYLGWSPDGKQLVITMLDILFLIAADGSQPARLIPGQFSRNWHASFSPDGQWLVFSSNRKFSPPQGK